MGRAGLQIVRSVRAKSRTAARHVSRLRSTRTGLLALGIIFLAAPLGAQDALAPGQTLAQQRAALARATAQAKDARRRSEQIEARANIATAAANRTRDQAAALAARIQASEADERAGEARIAIIAAQQREQARRLAVRQAPITRLTAALQQLARRSPVLALLEPGSVSDAVHRRIVLAQMLPVVLSRTRDLRTELARGAALRRSEEQAAAAQRKTRADLENQRKTLTAIEQRLRVAARQLHETAGAETERALAMGEEARDIGDLMARIKEAGTVREALLRLPGPTLRPDVPGATALPVAMPAPDAPTGRPPPYRLPVIGDVVTGFGEVSTAGLRSRGLSIATSSSATVVAPAAGHVAFAGPFRGYGQILIIEHGGGWTSLIANLGRLSAGVGDEVRQGDPIGAAMTGNRPQIVLELRTGETPVDIVALLR
ncbi:MAG: peptidoglycan DD-metalloendopeptidase family protein [Sphingobium sp.]|nr:peptidoglycan DD-metalloendopeptidase family protein [Sphingobium sp.]